MKLRVQSHEVFVGALVMWMHTPRGGYGYTVPVPGQVVALNPQGDRATIEVAKSSGAKVRRSVLTGSLRWREAGR